MQKDQSVQNAAAHLITRTRLCEHSPTEVALASCSSKGGVQTRVPSLPVVGNLAGQTLLYLASASVCM